MPYVKAPQMENIPQQVHLFNPTSDHLYFHRRWQSYPPDWGSLDILEHGLQSGERWAYAARQDDRRATSIQAVRLAIQAARGE